MISRTWHGPVRAAYADAYHAYFLRTGLPDYRETPGYCGVRVLRRVEAGVAHFLLMTCWRDYDAIRLFAGDEIERARYYPEDTYFLLDQEPFVRHHDVRRMPETGFAAPAGRLVRRWRGRTSRADADAYEALLLGEIAPGIEARGLDGYHGIMVLRCDTDEEAEFVTVMDFDSVEAVRAFAGDDYERAVVPPAAQRLLMHYDARAEHYDVLSTFIV